MSNSLFLIGGLLIAISGTVAAQDRPPTSWVDAGRAVPVEAEGRVLPLDTWARVVYSRVSGRDQDAGALEWFLTLLVFPERLQDQAFIVVNDPEVVSGTGIVLHERGRYSPQALAPLFERADEWAERFSDDPSPAGKESLRLAKALLLYRNLAATFALNDPLSRQSPLNSVFAPEGALNPALALASPSLPAPEKDRLALLLYWDERSKAGDWTEASQALQLFAGHKAALELFHNQIPWAPLTAVLALLGLALARFVRSRPGWLLVFAGLAWGTVTVWLVVRMLVSGRPPVTNLPTTFLLVSWLSLSLAFALASRTGQRTTALLALAAGGALPLLSMVFQGGVDPFSPLQAVLNTNFWLALHVTAIVSGYAATFGASLLGHAYLGASGSKIGGGALLPLWKNLQLALVLGLALALTGTLLGGFWADQSWGRFWGWDPKENGALLIVLWLALVLHLKPSGFTDEGGTALAAALGFPVLLFSWMGVNILGQGFHSYGYAPDKALVFFGLLAADAVILAVLILRKVLR